VLKELRDYKGLVLKEQQDQQEHRVIPDQQELRGIMEHLVNQELKVQQDPVHKEQLD
jgi:hypothetical protein